jgi:hypothetical protein
VSKKFLLALQGHNPFIYYKQNISERNLCAALRPGFDPKIVLEGTVMGIVALGAKLFPTTYVSLSSCIQIP